jgi:Lar family restriction alleviation protein
MRLGRISLISNNRPKAIMKIDVINGIIDANLEEGDVAKPCPFCGGEEVELTHSLTASYSIECANCGAQVPGQYGGELCPGTANPDHDNDAHLAAAKDALAAWNSRFD